MSTESPTTNLGTASANSNLQGEAYYNNLLNTGNPTEQSAAKIWLANNNIPTPGHPVYGPVVHAPGTPNTSTQSRNATAQSSSELDAALARLGATQTNPTPGDTTTTGTGTGTTPAPAVDQYGIPLNDPIMTGLSTLSANSDAATKALIANTQAAYQRNVNSVTSQYDSYKAGLQQLGVETNEAQSTPDILAGHIQQAANDEMTKIQTLDANEKKALMDANNAKTNNDFKTLQAKMTYVKQIQTEKATAIKAMHDAVVNSGKEVVVDAPALYGAFKSLDPSDGEKYILAVAQKYGASPIDVQSALLNEQAKETKTSRGGKLTVQQFIAQAEPDLKPISQGGVLGDDGYMAPEKWIAGKDKWIDAGLPVSTYNARFKQYLNPESYAKAGFKTSKSSDSSSGSSQPPLGPQ